MATFKPIVLKGKVHINKKKESNIKIEIIHRGEVDRIKTNYYVPPTLMDEDGKVKKEHPNSKFINTKLKEKTLDYEKTLLKLDEKFLEGLSVLQIKKILVGEDVSEIDFWIYAKKRIQELREAGRNGTANSYEDSVKRFKEVVKVGWLPFSNIDKKLLESFVTQKKKIINQLTA